MPKLLWASPFNLHDTSSGAALQCRTMLEKLRERGVVVSALGGFLFDHPSGASAFEHLDEKLAGGKLVFKLEDRGVSYLYAKTASRFEKDHTSEEQRRFFSLYCGLLNTFRPDVVMGYGGDMLSMCLRAEAKRRGIPVVYPLYNGNHGHFSFPDTDMVITDSRATADLYAKRDRINAQTTGIFIRRESYVAEKRDPRYVTFVNPHPTKGVGLFARLALMARNELPEVRFLVVQSRGHFGTSIGALHLPGSEEKPLTLARFVNVDVANHMSDMKPVYAATKALLAPSLWYESWGRVATEAVLNGIPVLASTSGGLPEAVGTGGITLEAPECCRADHLCLPSEESMRPWLDALKRLLVEDWSERCAETAAVHDIERSTDRALALLTPLFAKGAGMNPHMFLSGSLSG